MEYYKCFCNKCFNYLPSRVTINVERHCNTMKKLCLAIKRKRPGLLSNKVVLIHNTYHHSLSRTQLVEILLMEFLTILHIDPVWFSDFQLSSWLKEHLGRQHFQTDTEVKFAVSIWLWKQHAVVLKNWFYATASVLTETNWDYSKK